MRNSINKTTVLIVLAVFLTISVGYALFSDTITIEGTATAQGNFDVEATCVTDIQDKEFVEAYSDVTIEDNGFENEECIVNTNPDSTAYSVNLKYPGASKTWLIKFTNKGSVDAKMNAEVLNDGDFAKALIKTYDSKTNTLINSEEKTESAFIAPNKPFFQKASGEYLSVQDDWREFYTFDDDYGYFLLKPGASMYIPMKYSWSTNEKYSKDGEYYVATQTVSVDWMQAVGN